MKKLFMIVNEDRFFLSHRLPVAMAARREGFDVTIVTKDTGRSADIVAAGFRFIDLPINPVGMNPVEEVACYRFLRNLYRAERPDIVHHVGLKNILWGSLAAKKLRVGGVVNAICGLGSLFNEGVQALIPRVILAVMRYSNRRDNLKVIFQNYEDLSTFLDHGIVSQSQIAFTKGSGVDLDEFAGTPEPDTPVTQIIFTGRMVREKGVCDVIRAAEILRSEYEHKVRFVLCGRLTSHKGGISEQYMLDHCDGRYICWLGERDDVRRLLMDSHIMVFPSYYREGVPKSLIEACAIGRPIVTCNSVGCKDVVDDGINGFLVEPRSPHALARHIKTLLDDGDMRRRMGVAARRKAEKEFSISKVVDTHLSLYLSLLPRL